MFSHSIHIYICTSLGGNTMYPYIQYTYGLLNGCHPLIGIKHAPHGRCWQQWRTWEISSISGIPPQLSTAWLNSAPPGEVMVRDRTSFFHGNMSGPCWAYRESHVELMLSQERRVPFKNFNFEGVMHWKLAAVGYPFPLGLGFRL